MALGARWIRLSAWEWNRIVDLLEAERARLAEADVDEWWDVDRIIRVIRSEYGWPQEPLGPGRDG